MTRSQWSILFILLFCSSAIGQLELYPNQILDWPDENLELEEYYFTLFNDSEQDKSIMMTYEKVCVPEGWVTQLCDSLLCFSPSLDTVIIAIPAMSTWNMGLTLTGENVSEGAIYTFKVADNNNPDDEEVSWLFLNIENCQGTPLNVLEESDDKPLIRFERGSIIFDKGGIIRLNLLPAKT